MLLGVVLSLLNTRQGTSSGVALVVLIAGIPLLTALAVLSVPG